MELDKAIKERHTVRKFKTTKKVSYKDVITAVDAGMKCPLAGNEPSLKFIVVQDKKIIEELAKAAQQDFVSDVDFVVVVCSDKKFLVKSYYERGERYSKQQAGACIENILLKLTDSGLASCWVGAFSDETVKRVLRIPDEIDVEAMLPIGYELGKTSQKARPDLDSVLFFDQWKNKFMKPKNIVESTRV